MSSPGSSRSVGLAIFSAAIALQLIYAIFIYTIWGHTFLTADAVTHTYIGRLLWQNIANIGGVWLPLFHILVAPFTLSPFLYASGFAGVIVNSIASGLTSVLLYKMLPNRYGIILAAVFASNILTLSFSTTPMQESTAILFAVWAIYYLADYLRTERRGSFVKMAAVLTIGELARYEIWLLAIVLVIIFSVREVRHNRPHSLGFIHLAFWGVFLWLVWEIAIFRDPLFFLAPSGFSSIPSSPLDGVIRVLRRADVQSEIVALLLAFVALAASLSSSKMRRVTLSLSVLVLYLVTMSSQIALIPNGNFPSTTSQAFGYTIVSDSRMSFLKVAEIAHSSILISTRTGLVRGDLLSALSPALSVVGGVDPSRIVDEFSALFRLASAQPWSYVDYVVISKEGGLRGNTFAAEQKYYGGYFNYLYYSDQNWHRQFTLHFRLVLETSRFLLYQRVMQ